MPEARTEKCLDELSRRLEFGFEQGVKGGIGSLQRLMIGFFATTLGSIIAGVIVIVGSHS